MKQDINYTMLFDFYELTMGQRLFPDWVEGPYLLF